MSAINTINLSGWKHFMQTIISLLIFCCIELQKLPFRCFPLLQGDKSNAPKPLNCVPEMNDKKKSNFFFSSKKKNNF